MPDKNLWNITREDVKEVARTRNLSILDDEIFWDNIAEKIAENFYDVLYDKIEESIEEVMEAYE